MLVVGPRRAAAGCTLIQVVTMLALPLVTPGPEPQGVHFGRPSGRSAPGPAPYAAGLSALAAHEELNLLSTVAHELRSPLTALVTSSEVLAEDFEVLDQQQIRVMVSSIQRGALWLQGLLENLLCAATIRNGRFSVQPQAANLMEVVREVRPVLEPLLVQKSQRLRVRSRGTLPEVLADERRIGQVLVNLIANASKFSGAGTDIDLTLGTRQGFVRVAVADRGPGIPGVGAAHLFEPFYRGALASQAGKAGVGLGLAIVKSIVEAHGGCVGAENRRGGGACFWFELPRAVHHGDTESLECRSESAERRLLQSALCTLRSALQEEVRQ